MTYHNITCSPFSLSLSLSILFYDNQLFIFLFFDDNDTNRLYQTNYIYFFAAFIYKYLFLLINEQIIYNLKKTKQMENIVTQKD